jgi:hypothetical protein
MQPVRESGNAPPPIIVQQREDELVHVLGRLVAFSGTAAEIELVAVVHEEIVADFPDDIVREPVLDCFVPFLEDALGGRDDQVSERPVVVALPGG